jgi:hypothetical protein
MKWHTTIEGAQLAAVESGRPILIYGYAPG